jgi:hypothetical protein
MWEGRHNFQLNSATVLRDLYRLISMVVADHAILQGSEGQDDPLLRLRDQFLEDEFVHLLVGTAVTNRIQEEHMRGLRNDPGEPGFRPLVHECGSLQPDVRRDQRIALSFREACNKIIHAIHIVAETAGDPAHNAMPSTVTLRGSLGDAAWIAHLDIIEYVRASVRNFEDLR